MMQFDTGFKGRVQVEDSKFEILRISLVFAAISLKKFSIENKTRE